MATSGVPSAPASLARPRSGRGFAHLAAAQQSAGVTLVELAVIMAIVAVIAGVTAPVFAGYVQRANIATAIGDIKRLEVQIERFRSDTGGLPDTLAELGVSLPNDPWGNPYRFLNLTTLAPGDAGKRRKDKSLVPVNSDSDLYSAGPDGDSKAPFTAKASHDDIVRAGNGGFVGIADDY